MSLLDKILYEDENGTIYYELTNRKGKTWLWNARNVKTALAIYQPTSLKGKLFKFLFPYTHRFSFFCRLFHVRKKRCTVISKVEAFFDEIFPQSYELSFFGGTPSVHQKIVVQISSEKRLLAYCKISNRTEVAELFDHEVGNLDYLKKKGVFSVPEVLGRKRIGDFELFCQSSVKTSGKYRTSNKLRSCQLNAWKEIEEKTKMRLIFEETDYFLMLFSLKSKLTKVAEEYRNLLVRNIDRAMKSYQNKEVEFCFYHGDFTPWNMSFVGKKARFFDFEYAKRTYPPYLDLFHFYLQTMFFVKGASDDEILRNLPRQFTKCDRNIEVFSYFKLYLLEVIDTYLSRSAMNTEEEKIFFERRLALLEKAGQCYESKK